MACEKCREEFINILENRIRRILDLSTGDEVDEAAARAHCFHLMEIQRIIQGKPTCGIYDEHGSPITVKGPIFEAPHART